MLYTESSRSAHQTVFKFHNNKENFDKELQTSRSFNTLVMETHDLPFDKSKNSVTV